MNEAGQGVKYTCEITGSPATLVCSECPVYFATYATGIMYPGAICRHVGMCYNHKRLLGSQLLQLSSRSLFGHCYKAWYESKAGWVERASGL